MYGSRRLSIWGLRTDYVKIISMWVEFCSTKYCDDKKEEFTWKGNLDMDPMIMQLKTKNSVRFVNQFEKCTYNALFKTTELQMEI